MKIYRKIIEIDQDKCNGCGLCMLQCAEKAIALVDGKAKVISDRFCDGLGACLGSCPMDALHIIEREAESFDEAATHEHMCNTQIPLNTQASPHTIPQTPKTPQASFSPLTTLPQMGHNQWPLKLHLIQPHDPQFQNTHLCFTADCALAVWKDYFSYTHAKRVILSCPKLENFDLLREKMHALLTHTKPLSISLIRMEVPCCSGLLRAFEYCKKTLNLQWSFEEYTIGCNGSLVQKNG